MEKLQLKTKRVEVMIDDDPERVIIFNPNDVQLRARIYQLAKTTKNKELEIQEQIPKLDALEGEDELGIPLKDVAAQELMVELANFFITEIDATFGKGTSVKLFSDGFDFESMVVFIDFVTSKLREVSENKINQRLIKPVKGKKVMK